MSSSTSIVMLAAGGTGGHLFPAYALAEELGRRGYTVDLATDMRGDRYGTGFPARKIHQLPAATLTGRSLVNVLRTAATMARGIAAARRVMSETRPAVVVGFGGYPSFAPLVAARLAGIPTALHEQNAVLGRANRLLARAVSAIATSFPTVKLLEGAAARKAHFTGNPVRTQVVAAARPLYGQPDAGGPLRLVVFGGSQGARVFADIVPQAVAQLSFATKVRLSVVQQAREEDMERVRQAYAAAGVRAELAPFFRDLPERLATAHLVIGRAGASTIAELTVLGRPSILVPLPHALDADQLQNAIHLADAGGALCIEQKDFTPERLTAELVKLFDAPQVLETMAEAAQSQGRPDAVARLADLVADLIAKRVK
ncbi:MAG: undecaprenyldiphospho-muramoylpentapeptide beta-N-acetylglucosaminyltransferase [Hyphomicrobiaceae bacterium]